jgi:hypothetical protein
VAHVRAYSVHDLKGCAARQLDKQDDEPAGRLRDNKGNVARTVSERGARTYIDSNCSLAAEEAALDDIAVTRNRRNPCLLGERNFFLETSNVTATRERKIKIKFCR